MKSVLLGNLWLGNNSISCQSEPDDMMILFYYFRLDDRLLLNAKYIWIKNPIKQIYLRGLAKVGHI